MLGVCCERGVGAVGRDVDAARVWYEKARDGGSLEAAGRLESRAFRVKLRLFK
jgi:TPR repeat protein